MTYLPSLITFKFCNLDALYSLLVAMVILVVTKELVDDLSVVFSSLFYYVLHLGDAVPYLTAYVYWYQK